MRWNTDADLDQTLDAALHGKICVQVWLGIGKVLFIGFGDTILPATHKGEQHPIPPYELETGFTEWWVQDQNDILGTSNDDKENAEAAAAKLVGKKVIDWCMRGSTTLWIRFEDGLQLRMAPYNMSNFSIEDAWILRGPTHYGFVRWDGEMGNGRRDHYFIN